MTTRHAHQRSAIAAVPSLLRRSCWLSLPGAQVRMEEKHIEAMLKQVEHRREVVGTSTPTHISKIECASDSPLLSAKLKEAHALLEAERLEAFAPTGKKADSATFANPLDEQGARDDSDGDGDGEDGGGGGGGDNRT